MVGDIFSDQMTNNTYVFGGGDQNSLGQSLPQYPLSDLIFVIFSPQRKNLTQFFSTQKCVNCDKTDFATKFVNYDKTDFTTK